MLFVEVPYLIPAAGGGRTLPPGGGGRQRRRWESGESGGEGQELRSGEASACWQRVSCPVGRAADQPEGLGAACANWESSDAVAALAKGVDCGNGGHLLWCSCAQCSTGKVSGNTADHKDCLWVALLPIIDSDATNRDSSAGDR